MEKTLYPKNYPQTPKPQNPVKVFSRLFNLKLEYLFRFKGFDQALLTFKHLS